MPSAPELADRRRLAINGAWLHRPARFSDARGWTSEVITDAVWRPAGWRGFVQENQNYAERRGTVRGFHHQVGASAQARIIRVVRGAAYSVLLDLRPDASTYRRWAAEVLTAEGGEVMFVPAGCAHAVQTLEDHTSTSWIADAAFDPAAASGVLWNDPAIGVPWPLPDTTLVGDRDANFPRLDEL
jgi:dTDP-4-dehydrorhamnose 3,5-epimerase